MLDGPLETVASAERRATDLQSSRKDPSARFDIVISTLRRPSLSQLLLALDLSRGCGPERVIVVDDRPRPSESRPLPVFTGQLRDRVAVLRSDGRGQAHARNLGWRAGSAPWVVFLDDDVVPPHEWLARLHSDLARLDEKVAGSRGRVRAATPSTLERDVIGLESASWLASDMAYRRSALEALGGFDEWFMNAYRDDVELSQRALFSGYALSRGRRHVQRLPGARSWDRLAAVSSDRRAAALHRIAWKRSEAASGGRFARHVAVAAGALATGAGLLSANDYLTWLGAGTWIVGSADVALARIPEGPCQAREAGRLIASSVLIPFVDVLERARVHARFAWQSLRCELARSSWLQRLQGRARVLAEAESA
jgi:hypothetical protein